jgi:hypothetical protein
VPPNTSPSRVNWPLLVALLPFVVLVVYHWTWGVPAGYGDHAQYLAHARALVEGRAYSDIEYIYHPAAPMLGPRAYPPGFPLTLAPLVAIGGTDSPLIRLLMFATLIIFGYLAYGRLARAIPQWQAALAIGLALLSIEVHFGSVVPLSDPGFCAILWGLILAVDSAPAWTWRRIALVTALGFAAMAYRVPGIAVIPALALYALLTWPRHRGRALIPVVIWSAAGFAVLASGIATLPFESYLLPRSSQVGARLASVLRVYRIAVFELELYPFARGLLNDIYHLIASIFLIAGSAALLWRHRRTMLTSVVVAYLALLTASPAIDGRYLWPLYPVLTAGLVIAAAATWRAIASRLHWRAMNPAWVALVFVLIFVGGLWRAIEVPAPRSLDRQPDAQALYTWLQDRKAREPVRVVFHNPRVLSLATRVPAMGALLATPTRQLAAMREREITHIVWQNSETNTCRTRLLNSLPRMYPGHFALEYENPTFRVYRLRLAGPLPPDTVALGLAFCQSLPPT